MDITWPRQRCGIIYHTRTERAHYKFNRHKINTKQKKHIWKRQRPTIATYNSHHNSTKPCSFIAIYTINISINEMTISIKSFQARTA